MGASVPQARIVRKGTQLFAPPPAPPDDGPHPVRDQLRELVGFAVGVWPLTGVMLLALGLVLLAGMNAAP